MLPLDLEAEAQTVDRALGQEFGRIVDPDSAEAERARQAVEVFGYRCRTARTAAAAREALGRVPPDVVIVAP